MKKPKKALKIQKGVESVSSINQKAKLNAKRFQKKQKPAQYYVDGILAGDRTILSQAITLVESVNPKHQSKAREIIQACLPYSGNSIRIGITGVPGVGKSTFIETFGLYLCQDLKKKVAVLAVDPSSEKTGGSILGDKTRMEELSVEKNAFIRPSPSASSLGGVSRKTRETILLCEACGFDTILIETVGVGQSETAVHSMVDFFLLLMLAGAGDELQGIKRGIMEMADAIALTKADGENALACKKAKNNYQYALHMLPAKESDWIPPVLLTSSLEKHGISEIATTIDSFKNKTHISGYFDHHRKTQNQYWFHESMKNQIGDLLYSFPRIKKAIKQLDEDIIHSKINPFDASDQIFYQFLEEIKNKPL